MVFYEKGVVMTGIQAVPFQIWQTVEIPSVSPKEFISQWENKGLSVGKWAKFMMEQDAFKPLLPTQILRLGRRKAGNLGIAENLKTSLVLGGILRQAGDFYPPAAVPYILPFINDEANGTTVYIAMQPIAGSGGIPAGVATPRIFTIRKEHDGSLVFDATVARFDRIWNHEDEFIAVLR